ncbi:MAG: hypothetical protein CMH54_09335 [Myxococcales bacterium]|nr:hypothetical protein [Myxococcales bacterium]
MMENDTRHVLIQIRMTLFAIGLVMGTVLGCGSSTDPATDTGTDSLVQDLGSDTTADISVDIGSDTAADTSDSSSADTNTEDTVASDIADDIQADLGSDDGCPNPPCDCEVGTLCGNECVDLLISDSHCGDCFIVCPEEGSCDQGSCTCPGDKVACGIACIDVNTDPNHCGACASPCSEVQLCEDGACACPDGLTACGDECIDTSHNPDSCGDCSTVCDDKQSCVGGVCVSPAPRPIAPLSTALVTSQTPTFRFEPSGPGVDTRLELCADRACDGILSTHDTDTAELTIANALDAGTFYWRLRSVSDGVASDDTSPIWQVRVGHRSAPVSTSFGNLVDPYNDGIPDIITGNCAFGEGGCDHSFYVYDGTNTGLSPTANTSISGPAGSLFGMSVASAGDVNGDGYADVIVGAFYADQAYLYLGSADGLGTEPATIIDYQGSAIPGLGSWFGLSVHGAGDVNGDGYGDIVIGATLAGAVIVYHGSPNGIDPAQYTTLLSTQVGLGASVSGAGDVNGDGYADIVAGDSGHGAYVYLGSENGLPTDPAHVLEGPPSSQFGTAVGGKVDVNGDGYSDVIVGAPNIDLAYLYYGGPSGLTDNPTIMSGGAGFGMSVDNAGDVNGDGYGDVVIGGNGSFKVYLGSDEGINVNESIHITGNSSVFGNICRGLGDLNQDGFDDIITNEYTALSVYVFQGGLSGTQDPAAYQIIGPTDVLGFAWTLAEATCSPTRP